MPDDRYTEARDVLIHKADQPREETICWEGHPQYHAPPYENKYIADYRGGYVIGSLRSSVRIWDRTIANVERADEETIAWAREEVDPHCCVPQWFVQKFRRVMDDENEAAALLNMYMDQLLQKSEFEIIYETGRKLFLEENEGGQCAMAETMAIV